MTRMYIQPSFVDSCSDHGEWSGGNGQYRGDRSVEVVPTYINGRPNVRAFSDEAIEARRAKKKTSVPLKQRILPQASRLDKLNAEILELEKAYRAGEYSPEEYTVLRDVAFAKRDRQEILLNRAKSLKPKSYEQEEYYEQSTQETCEIYASATAGVSHKGSDVERRNSPIKLRINVPKDLVFFLTGSVVMLVLLKMLV